MQLALDGQDKVQVLLGLHEVAEVGGDDLGHRAVAVGGYVQVSNVRLLLWLLSLMLERLVVVWRVSDKVGYEILTHEVELVLHGDACFGRFHHVVLASYKMISQL